MYKTPGELRAELPLAQVSVPLSQGDILDACPLIFWADQVRWIDESQKPQSVQSRVIILTQACDLANEKTARAIVAVVHQAQYLVETGRVKEKFIRDNVRKGQVYGWYFLPAHASCPEFPESLVDLRDLHITPATKKVVDQPDAPARDPVISPRWRVGLLCSTMRNFFAEVIRCRGR
jgi:hypothetical protein